jgi:tetratricopeptide (TPR) repeat protein
MIFKALRQRFSAHHPSAPTAPAAIAPAAAEKALLLDPAHRALQAGHKDEAERLLTSLLRDHHDLVEAHLLLGTLLRERRQYEDARDSYTLARCFEPKWWTVHFHFGLLELDESRPREAIPCLLEALKLGAQDARVHNALGAAYTHTEQLEKALEQFRVALALQPDSAEVHNNLGYILFRDFEEYEAGAEHIETARRLTPDALVVLCNWSMVLQNSGRVDEALAICDMLLARDPGLTEARVTRALILLMRGEFAAGWAEYEERKRLPRYHSSGNLPWPEWDGSDLAGKTIFVYPEQGLGDEIMFASCVPDLMVRAGTCIIECHAKLERVFRRSFPKAVIVGKDAWQKMDVRPDCKVAIGSLPRFLRNRREDFPSRSGYLRADATRVQYWREQLAALPGRTKVGISWRGGAPSTRRRMRSIPLDDWTPLLTLPDLDFVSLQYSPCADEIAQAQKALGLNIQHWPEAVDDYDETAALVVALDLVISVQTAVVHLAGALGQRVWALLPAVPEWRYGATGENMPWYPRVRLMRQEALGDWEPVMRAVSREVSKIVTL